jgi:RNA polymerase sigma factor (sigma-70 family)
VNVVPNGLQISDRSIIDTVSRETARLARFIRHRVSDSALAEDILQDVMVQYLEAEHSLRPIEQTAAWLYRVARNRITDWFRRKKPVSLDALLDLNEAVDSLGAVLTDAGPSPERQYGENQFMQAFEQALDELPAAQRAVFIAHELDGRSFRELADETGENVNTLLSRKHLAVRHLRQSLGEEFEDWL